MAVREIVVEPAHSLRDVSVPASDYGKDIKQLICDLKDTLYETNAGVGIAAPQIGENVRVFLVDTYANTKGEARPHIFIDPEILNTSADTVVGVEGCLSCPDVRARVERPASLVVRYTDEDGHVRTVKLSKLTARVFQHEFDHLDGITLTRRIEEGTAEISSD